MLSVQVQRNQLDATLRELEAAGFTIDTVTRVKANIYEIKSTCQGVV
jgi:hypothetical protein